MKLYELNPIGVSVANELQSMRGYEIEDPDTAGDEFAEMLSYRGWDMLDSGGIGDVYSKEGVNFVLKVATSEDPAYRDFVALTKKISNRHFPKIAGPFNINGYDIYAIETLQSLTYDGPAGRVMPSDTANTMFSPEDQKGYGELLNWWTMHNSNKSHPVNSDNKLFAKRFLKKYGKSFFKALMILRKWKPEQYTFDMYDYNPNVMVRPSTNELVIMDPLV